MNYGYSAPIDCSAPIFHVVWPQRARAVGVSDIFYRMRPPVRRQSRPCFAESEDFHCGVCRHNTVGSALPPIPVSSIRARGALRPSRLRSNAIGRRQGAFALVSHPADHRSAPELVPCPDVATPAVDQFQRQTWRPGCNPALMDELRPKTLRSECILPCPPARYARARETGQ